VRIAINALYLLPGAVGGTEIYLRRLLDALESLGGHDYVVFSNLETGPLGRNPVVVPLRAESRPKRILFEQLRLPGLFKKHHIDAVLNPGFTAPLLTALPQTTVFHDLQHKRHPEYFRWFDLPFWQFLLWASAHRSHRLIAVSQATAEDITRYYSIPESRIQVVPHGVEPAFFQLAPRREPHHFFLCSATLHPHKNHARLLRVFARFRHQNAHFRLVLTGVRGFVAADIENLVAELGLQDAVDLLGWVPREELHELFRTAAGFVYPSLFEGFGMPVVEALAADIPLACSDIEPLRSLAGDTALLFDPQSEDSMLLALEKLARGEAPGGRVERAASFTWQRAAVLTQQAISDSLRA